MQVLTDYTYLFSKDVKPIAEAEDGEVVQFVTRDCFNRRVTTEDDSFEKQLEGEECNPATGPLYVKGAEPGDVLKVDILKIDLEDHGTVALGMGPLKDENTPDRFRILPIKDGKVKFLDVEWPVEPMIGVIGCPCDDHDVPTMNVFEGGGNMDSNKIVEGATLWIPVRVTGGLLEMGDVHATMGDGEVCGTGLEIGATITVKVSVLKDFKLNWPVTELKDRWYVNTRGENCDEAIRAGYIEMRRLISQAYGWDSSDTALYMTLQGYLESNQACLVPTEGGDSFRTGTPKRTDKPRLIPLPESHNN